MSTATAVDLAGGDTERLTLGTRTTVRMVGFGLGLLGVLLCGAAWSADAHRFAFSYLVGFEFVLTLGLGGLFFVVIQHLVQAGWSVGPRRQMEWLAGILPVMALLFIPVALQANQLYAAWMGPGVHEPAITAKAAFLNPTFFFIRAGVYFTIWTLLSYFFRTRSLAQDKSGDPGLTLAMQRYSAPSIALFALSVTFAAFDWLMSLEPKWYSTIFGVYFFSGCVVSSLAALALMTVALHRSGLIKKVSHVEHRYDIGKFLFAFTVFWAYIAFSQYFLIWYANIPEETIFYRERTVGSWRTVSQALVLLQFATPFVVLLSRTMKKLWWGLSLGALLVLTGHYVDLYWLVMPTLDAAGAQFSWIDLAGLLGPLGVLLAWLAHRATTDALYPLRDPRLHEARALDNP